MSDAWMSFPNAPRVGTRVCREDAMNGDVMGVDLDGFPLLLVRSDDGLRAYVNTCPHQFLPLDWRASNILSTDKTVLRCSNHDAGFEAATGQGIDGFGQGCELDPVPIAISDGVLVIGTGAL